MTARRHFFSLTAALAIGTAAVAPALANPASDTLPGNPVMSCRVVGMSGGGENTQVTYSSECAPMQSLNVVRKGALGVPRVYGETQTPIMGGGRVLGWEGGREGGPAYESGILPDNVPLASND